ncbi:hypothetical protein QBC38DRAFT_472955 [Podospora fimiseda]|uniref:Uncharacterized protein n=1 Tax=Podospora fimiseda TaxID=252190 RepID=A0AAN7BTH2_9PEZI|nr:hypothetical protein QBC38DRAFT_472955 [Podospora fimiseda]
MVIKRKRSDSDFGSFNSTVGGGPSTNFNFDAIAAMDTARRGFFSPRLSTPSHIHNRTMKRCRDNRPSEELIHQRTLNLLYSAQHQQSSLPSTPEITVTPVTPHTPSRTTQSTGPQQLSLHSFWNLPSSSSSSVNSSPSRSGSIPPPSTQQVSADSTTCEDCGVCLRGGANDSDGDMMMDVDMDGNTCCACGKAVCFGCSVSNLGENRRCLVCAGREERSGWTASVDVF